MCVKALHAQVRPAARARIRALLPDLNDWRAILTILRNNPDHLGIIGVLSIGIAAALLLALLGTLISSWFNASTRLTGFAVARALGMSPRQVVARPSLGQTLRLNED
jgi:hypothetical protein